MFCENELNMEDTITITGCFEDVFEYITKRRSLDDDDIRILRPDNSYDFLNFQLGLSDIQSELMACILNESVEGNVTASKIASYLGISNLKFLTLRPEFEELAERRLIRTNSDKVRGARFVVPDNVLKAFAEDRIPDNSDISNLSISALLKKMASSFRSFWNDEIDLDTLKSDISLLYSANPQNGLVQAFYSNKVNEMCEYEIMLLFFMLVRNVQFMENCFSWEDYCKIFEESEMEDDIHFCIMSGNLELMGKGLVEYSNNDGLEDRSNICLSDKALKEFIGDIIEARTNKERCFSAADIIHHDQIKAKNMFYNAREQKEIERLTTLLDKEHFREVTSRLDEKGMRKGFACLFYGVAGSGKTETCYSISAKTGRDIYFVDMAELKSKWVGDSERNVRDLFREYRKAVRDSELAPIMVWNEVDAIFGKRRKVENAVDKMENAMQNIILQELENLEGILIATTNFNLKDGFDSAFERRFIIKVRFDKPGIDTRAKIWNSMFGDELSEYDTHKLASEFDFTGGTVENINRKSTVDYILTGQHPTLESVRELCLAEKTEETIKKPIGF